MHRSKLVLLGLCVVALSLMALTASLASAAEWLNLKTQAVTETITKTAAELPAIVEGETEPKTDGTLLSSLLGIKFGVLCTTATLNNAKLVGGGTVSSGFKATFTGCTVMEEPSGKALPCTVKSPGAAIGTIATNELKGQLQENGETLVESNKTVVEGTKTVGVFAELEFGEPECPFKSLGKTPVKGVLWLKDCEGKVETHLVKHLIVESTAHGHTLWLGSNNAEHLETSIDGSGLAFLGGEHKGLEWGAELPKAEWLISKTQAVTETITKTAAELPAIVEGETEPKTDGTLLSSLLGIKFGVLCTTATLNNAKLVGGGTVSSGFKATFTGCTVMEEPSGKALPCTVKSPGAAIGTIATNELKGQLQENGETLVESNKTVVEGTKTVGVFAELEFGEPECPFKSLGKTPVKGVLWLKDCEGKVETHLVKHLIVESTAHGHTLWLGSNNAEHLETSIDGSGLAFLGGEHKGLEWGAELPKAEWLISKTQAVTETITKTAAELPAIVEGETEPKTDGTLLSSLLGIKFGVLCPALTLENAKLVGGGAVSSGFKATFTGCTVVEEPSGTKLPCTVKSPGAAIGTIATNELKGQLQTNGEVLIESNKTVVEGTKTVGVFAELEFGEPECPFKSLGKTPGKGVLWLKDCEGKVETHLVKHLIVESTAHGHTLWLGSNNAEHLETSIDGSGLAFLGGEHKGLEWGAELPKAEWLISKTQAVTETITKTAAELPAIVEGETEPKTDGTLLSSLLGIKFGVLCPALTLENAKLVGGGAVSSGFKATFTGCTVVEEPSGTKLPCTVKSPGAAIGTIATNELKGQLQTNGEVLIESNKTVVEGTKTVGVFAELEFGEPECPFKSLGKTPGKGVLWLKDCEGKVETHLVKHLIVESTAHGKTLWLGADNAEHLETSIDGSGLAFLGGEHKGLEWGATLP